MQRDRVVDHPGARLRFSGLAHEPLRRDRAVDLVAAAEVVRRNQANVVEHRGHVEDLGIGLEPVMPCQLDGPGIDPDRVVHKEGRRNVRDELAGSPRERGIRNGDAELGECLVHDLVGRLYGCPLKAGLGAGSGQAFRWHRAIVPSSVAQDAGSRGR